MITSSCWGKPNGRIYKFIKKYGKNLNNVCIIGCSDGKYVFPFLRNGYSVTAIDIDKVALFGGEKESPVKRANAEKREYVQTNSKPVYDKVKTERVCILGLEQRARLEKLDKKLSIIERDVYHNPIDQSFDVVFTSCSIQYKGNRDISAENIMSTLKGMVNPDGYLYMDYMMPLQDIHEWKSELFFRKGQIKEYFDDTWEIFYIYEMSKPVFEFAHIDRNEDHFHRFGYILARKRR